MIELNDFFNDGHGWICKQCDLELRNEAAVSSGPARFFSEGEAEGGGPRLETAALAKWTDRSRRYLACPRCGISEAVEKS
jgi:hypothetical protein